MNILLVDDERDVRKSLANFLAKLGHTVTPAANGLEGLREFHNHTFDLVITDIRMPGMDGLELLRRLKQVERSSIDVIIITGHGDVDNAVKSLKFGAYDYLQKPIDVRELAITLERSAEYRALRNNYSRLQSEFNQRVESETRLYRGETARVREAYLKEVGLDDLRVYSQAMRDVVDLAEKYSVDRSLPVLIQGESGTGKELIARYIHYFGSNGRPTPFVPINCGAVTPELFEGELFGHEAGAFTGAAPKGRIGKMEAANKGAVFLDEIGEMAPALQVKLLRVIEEKKFFRVGGVREIPLDVRVISATNKELRHEVEQGGFRLDLFYRLNAGSITIPPLRERETDILPLAVGFIKRACSRRGKEFDGFTPEAESFLTSYAWPGNVRQLKNAMERVALMDFWDKIDAGDLSFINRDEGMIGSPTERTVVLGQSDFILPERRMDLEKLNREIIVRALEKHGGNQTRTAQYLGITRRALQGRLKKL